MRVHLPVLCSFGIGALCACVAPSAFAQATSVVGEAPPPGYEEALAGPSERPRVLDGRNFSELEKLSEQDLQTEAQELAVERDARVRLIDKWRAEIQELDKRIKHTSNEKALKPLNYDRARTNYLMATQQNQLRLISDRLDMIAKERVRRRGENQTPPDPTDEENLNQMQRAVQLMEQYDKELQSILSRDPVTEVDVIEALTVIKRGEVLTEAFRDYFTALQTHKTRAAAAPSTQPVAE